MSQAQIKILAAVFALTLLAGTVIGAFYFYEKVFKPEITGRKGLKETLASNAPKSDPGKTWYDQSIDLIRRNDLEAAQDRLRDMIETYPDSSRLRDARRVLGEMNMDRLFSRAPMPGKLEYTVTNERGMEAIAKKSLTTISYIRRVNNLGNLTLHSGDRLILYPLEFEIEVRMQDNLLTLNHKGTFFKEYDIVGFNLAAGTRRPPKTVIGSRSANFEGKPVAEHDVKFAKAKKWIQTISKPGRPGIIFCGQPTNETEGPFGIYLAHPDIDEIWTIIRTGTPLVFVN